VALALVTGSTIAMAQDHVYFLSYFANAHTLGAPDGTLRLANDGNVSDRSPAGDLCASIYVFDSTEQMLECCGCLVTPNGYLSLSVDRDLTSDPILLRFPTRGLFKVVSSLPSAPGACNPTTPVPKPGMRAWITHVEAAGAKGPYSLSVEQLTDSSLGSSEFSDLAEDCDLLSRACGDAACICSCTDSGR